MTPNDWHKGMENEAASVEDGVWAQETQEVLLQSKRRKLLTDALASLGAALVLAVVWMTGSVLVARVAWHMDTNAFGSWATENTIRFDLLFLGLLLTTGLLLGWREVQAGRVALALACLPLILWITGSTFYVQGVWSDPAVSASPVITDFFVYTLRPESLIFSFGAALCGFLSAWGGLNLRRIQKRNVR